MLKAESVKLPQLRNKSFWICYTCINLPEAKSILSLYFFSVAFISLNLLRRLAAILDLFLQNLSKFADNFSMIQWVNNLLPYCFSLNYVSEKVDALSRIYRFRIALSTSLLIFFNIFFGTNPCLIRHLKIHRTNCSNYPMRKNSASEIFL